MSDDKKKPVTRESLGAVPCLCCGQAVPVKKSAGGSISVSCPWCDLSAYAKDGTQAHRKIVARLPKIEELAPAPTPKAAPMPPPVPKPAARNPLFPGA